MKFSINFNFNKSTIKPELIRVWIEIDRLFIRWFHQSTIHYHIWSLIMSFVPWTSQSANLYISTFISSVTSFSPCCVHLTDLNLKIKNFKITGSHGVPQPSLFDYSLVQTWSVLTPEMATRKPCNWSYWKGRVKNKCLQIWNAQLMGLGRAVVVYYCRWFLSETS